MYCWWYWEFPAPNVGSSCDQCFPTFCFSTIPCNFLTASRQMPLAWNAKIKHSRTETKSSEAQRQKFEAVEGQKLQSLEINIICWWFWHENDCGACCHQLAMFTHCDGGKFQKTRKSWKTRARLPHDGGFIPRASHTVPLWEVDLQGE